MSLTDLFKPELTAIETFLHSYLNERFGEASHHNPLSQLQASVRYGVLSGGKRFRPLLAVLTADCLQTPSGEVLPLAAALEFVHSYSLIHDDLPVMDNDDFRRGQPTNHKVFGEALALLAGDGLLTEAFRILASGYYSRPEVGLRLVNLLSEAAGLHGMVGGQALDLEADGRGSNGPSPEQLQLVHQLKTGALIAAAVDGAAVVAGAKGSALKDLHDFGRHLGLAFQLADDIEDDDPQAPESSGYPSLMGIEKTRSYLQATTSKALLCLEGFGRRADRLKALTQFNVTRVMNFPLEDQGREFSAP